MKRKSDSQINIYYAFTYSINIGNVSDSDLPL